MESVAESNVMRLNDDDAHYIIVDVDSNTILYHPVWRSCLRSVS